MMKMLLFVVIYLTASTVSKRPCSDSYDYIIVGGGFSGLYTAMRLGENSNGNLKIAIVEKKKSSTNWHNTGYPKNGIQSDSDACLGGRIEDYPYECIKDNINCPSNGIVWYGEHAVRYKSTQGIFFLAHELGFQEISNNPHYEYGESEGSMGHDRGFYFRNGDGQSLIDNKYIDDFNYGTLISKMSDVLNGCIWDTNNVDILCNEEENKFHSFASYYANATGSSNGVEFVQGSFRFKSDFAGTDSQGQIEFWNDDAKSSAGWTVYPIGGMSEFIRRMYIQIVENDYADIYCDFEVSKVEKASSTKTGKYLISSKKKKNSVLSGNKIILTTPILALREMNGLINDITACPEALNWNPMTIVTCMQQFEQKWWKNKVPKQYFMQKHMKKKERKNIKVDTWFSRRNCMQQMEYFNSEYLRSVNVVTSLYVDESECSEYWKALIVGSDYDMDGVVADEIRARHAEYFGVTITDIPSALSTECEIIEDGWNFLSAGATDRLGNNPSRRVEEWAYKPLENEDIFMCGEMWSNRHAWADGGRAHCDLMMNKKLNVNKKYLPQFRFSLHERAQCNSVCHDDGQDEIECIEFPEEAILK